MFLELFGGDFLSAAIRLAAPLLLAALGGALSERSGVLNIGLEGMMLAGAFFATAGAVWSGDLWTGVVLGILAGALLGAVLGVFAVSLYADQITTGIVLNIFALGLTSFLLRVFFGVGGAGKTQTPPFDVIPIPYLSDLPVAGPILFRHILLVYLAVFLVAVLTYLIFRTPLGLSIRATGEFAKAADMMGIPVAGIRYACVIGSGALAGLAGAFLSLGHVHVFVDNITQGKGYIALAVVILGRWRPVGALIGALIFGGAEALQFRVHTLKVPIPEQVPVMLPYVLTIIALVGSMKKTRPPAEDGIPYIKEGS